MADQEERNDLMCMGQGPRAWRIIDVPISDVEGVSSLFDMSEYLKG